MPRSPPANLLHGLVLGGAERPGVLLVATLELAVTFAVGITSARLELAPVLQAERLLGSRGTLTISLVT